MASVRSLGVSLSRRQPTEPLDHEHQAFPSVARRGGGGHSRPALPAVAQTNEPNATAPTAAKPMAGDAKTDTSKIKATNKKPVKPAAHKPAKKTPVVKTAAPAADSKTPVSK